MVERDLHAKRIEINEVEAKIIRTIFALDGQGRTVPQIAESLNERGDSRCNGGPSTSRQVRKILSRRALYVDGVAQYGSSKGKSESWVVVQ